MNKCCLCEKVNYQTATTELIFDAYCVSCRGLFQHLTVNKGFDKPKAKKVIKTIYGESDRLPVGEFQMEGFVRRTIRLTK